MLLPHKENNIDNEVCNTLLNQKENNIDSQVVGLTEKLKLQAYKSEDIFLMQELEAQYLVCSEMKDFCSNDTLKNETHHCFVRPIIKINT